jgi:hypothetical protein
MTMIADRPAQIEDRCEAGHWEGDLIICKGDRFAIRTLVERRTRYVILIHVPSGRTAESIRDGLREATAQLPPSMRRTLTWDQGKEMALHTQTSRLTGFSGYFYDPHSPWQRGSNENMNGLLRQYFPKGSCPRGSRRRCDVHSNPPHHWATTPADPRACRGHARRNRGGPGRCPTARAALGGFSYAALWLRT